MNGSHEDSVQLLQLSQLNRIIFIFGLLKLYRVNNYHQNPIQILQLS